MYSEDKWKRLKNVAALRVNRTSDQYSEATRRIISSTGINYSNFAHHTNCHRKYTAVKRPTSDKESSVQVSKKPKIETRKASCMPKSDKHGLLKGVCLFCGKKRRKKRGNEERLSSADTSGGFDRLEQRAKHTTNERVKSLMQSGIDIISKEAEYHKSCRTDFNNETDKYLNMSTKQGHGPTYFHQKALDSIEKFIETEVIGNQRSVLVTSLLEMYKEAFISNGGNATDVSCYKTQSLVRKVKGDRFDQRVKVLLADQRRGNFVYSSSITEEDARANLHDDAERHKEDDKIKWAALHLRSLIMQIPKTKTPNPATVHNLKECAPTLPEQLDLFFRTLLCGSSQNDSGPHKEKVDRKVTAMAADAVYNVSHGTVKPWKHTMLGLGLASLTGSKVSMQMLNRAGHSINYCEVKGLETEFAYSVESDLQDTPDGIHLKPGLATATVWDNNDANIETLDGKGTLHSTVGHTYQNIEQENEQASATPATFRVARNRRRFVGKEREIPTFRKALSRAKFVSVASTERTAETESPKTTTPASTTSSMQTKKPTLKPLDLYWFWRLREGNTPLYAGFISQYVKDILPLQRICYMDPIPRSPTNNDVVRETMVRSMSVAKETGQDYAVVTYDLAVALKAYSIQALETPLFDNLLIMLGNFHVELAFFGAIGTMISESGIEVILSEADTLAEGSMLGFMKGKFYNRCTRVHELVANVLEQKLYEQFYTSLDQDEKDTFQMVMNTIPADPQEVDHHLTDPAVTQHLQKYETFFQGVLDGNRGPTAQFWATYVYLINRLHRELQRCVKTNDVQGYIDVLPAILDVFFSLNRPNYARWGTLFLQKLVSADPRLLDILQKGAFSVRRTTKNYSRSAVDLSLEQSVNRDAASQMKGIVAFRNSESAMRRWHLTMTQRAMAVTELRSFTGLVVGDTAAAQCRSSRIKKDNKQMVFLSQKIDEFCNPFADDVSGSLVNIATGRAASKQTKAYLLDSLKRGAEARDKFQSEWDQNSSRFLERVKRNPVQNFASENAKKKSKLPAAEMARTNAESMRDVFIRLIVVAAESSILDLQNVLSYPITEYPLSLAHCDGSIMKTDKSTLLKKLESMQTTLEIDMPMRYAHVFDGGLLLHSVLSKTNIGASYASIARTLLSVVCAGKGSEVHVCLDKYLEKSIKGSERELRGAVNTVYKITGSEQSIRQSGEKLIKNGKFKDELARFLLKEWGKDHYCNYLVGKTLYASYGGECYQYITDELQKMDVSKPLHLQGDHEEADTLIAFHVANTDERDVIVRASDTDVLVILIGELGQLRPELRTRRKIIMDCGSGNSQRYINVSNITEVLEQRRPGLARAIPGCHAFTGCDFTSAFFR